MYEEIVTIVNKSTDYSLAKSEDMERLADMLNTNFAHDYKITPQQVMSIRNAVIKQKIVSNYARMNREISKIAAKYKSGAGYSCIWALIPRRFAKCFLRRQSPQNIFTAAT